jgi:hypothetical protein
MKRGILSIAVILILAGCGGSGGGSSTTSSSPAAATLSTPANNSVCITGIAVSATTSSVSFTWAAAANATTYDLYVKNLLTSATTTQSNLTTTSATLTILTGTPYSWYIVSKSLTTSTTGQSITFKFYNSGPGITTYAPFPATVVSPTFGQNISATGGNINLTWTGGSVNAGTIVNYDVYFGTVGTPPLLKATVTDSFLNSVAVTSGITYYWKIITRDSSGNTSDSGVYQFKVN